MKLLKLRFMLSLLINVGFQTSYTAELLHAAEAAFKKSEYKKAEKLYKEVLQSAISQAVDVGVQNRATINLAETLLALGKYEEGQQLFDARLQNTDIKRKPLQKPWSGAKIELLLVRGEHGIGDTFFFMRYMKQANDAGILIAVRERDFLKPLLSRQSYISRVLTSDQDEEKVQNTLDEVYAMSLPRYVSNKGLRGLQTVEDIPYSAGYIEPRIDLVKKWQLQFSDKQKLHILIGAYRASKNVAGECRFLKRDIAIADLIKKLAGPNVVLYYPCGGEHRPIKLSEYETLKRQEKLGELDELDVIEDADIDKIVLLNGDFDKSSGAFEDTAAAACASDYVISVDTSTAMLAGALGVKIFAVLLPKESDWRWGEEQSTKTPFFSNAELFWQKEQDDWSEPLDALSKRISEVAKAKKGL